MGLLIKLQDGDTAFKSLKFGNDRPGGGDSGQPYIKTSINKPDTPALNSDFLLRGGISAPLNALEDVARLTKYFFDFKNPKGLLFTAKQNLLSRVAPKTEASFGPAYGGFAKDISPKTGIISQNQNNGFFNAGVYTPLSTIAEAGVVAFGGHLNKQGIDPTGLISSLSIRKYGDIAFANNQPEKNSEDPKVPLALWRKSQNASNKAGRKLVESQIQQSKTQNELAVNVSLPNTGFDEFGANRNSFAQSNLNQFLQKWDAYRDKQAIKKLKKKDEATSKALDKQDELYQQVVNAENAPKTYANRLLNLWNLNGLNQTNPIFTNSSILYSYSGGPDSTLGVGNTDIKFATLGDGLTPVRTNNIPFEDPTKPTVYYSTLNIFGDEKSSVSLRYAKENTSITDYDLFGVNNFLETNNGTPDKRLGIAPGASNQFITNPKSYLVGTQREPERDIFTNFTSIATASIAYEKLTGKKISLPLEKEGRKSWEYVFDNSVYQPGTLTPITNIGTYNTLTQNKINALSSERGTKTYKPKSPLDKSLDQKVYYDSKSLTRKSKSLLTDFTDLIEFNFTILDPQNPSSPGTVLDFRAYLDSFSDSYSNDWKSQTYMGRAEKFYKYDSFDRSISLGFTIVADNQDNLKEMYSQLNTLASSIAPSYTSQGYMAGVLHKLTVGNYVNKQYGILQGLTFEVTDDTPWQIDTDNQLPLYIKVTGIKFTPIHNFRPEVILDKQLKTNAGGQKYYVPKLIEDQNQRYISQKTTHDDVPIPEIENPSKPRTQQSQVSVTGNQGTEVGIPLNPSF
jgi:hypothetical protein